jgi:hypothetical protein
VGAARRKAGTGEAPRDCVRRQIEEDVGWQVTVGPLLDLWQYHIRVSIGVRIVIYGCHLASGAAEPVVSHEHKRLACSPLTRFLLWSCPTVIRPPSKLGMR